jgi:hypothetical protein
VARRSPAAPGEWDGERAQQQADEEDKRRSGGYFRTSGRPAQWHLREVSAVSTRARLVVDLESAALHVSDAATPGNYAHQCMQQVLEAISQ